MIKPKYPKRADISQIARSIVEYATGTPLSPSPEKPSNKKGHVRYQESKRRKNPNN